MVQLINKGEVVMYPERHFIYFHKRKITFTGRCTQRNNYVLYTSVPWTFVLEKSSHMRGEKSLYEKKKNR